MSESKYFKNVKIKETEKEKEKNLDRRERSERKDNIGIILVPAAEYIARSGKETRKLLSLWRWTSNC